MKKIVILIAFIMVNAMSYSQLRQISVVSDISKRETNEETKLALTDKNSTDYVLYRDVIRKYTWYEGVGTPITQETADHLPFYFRLSMKNSAGHYLHIEAMYQNRMSNAHDKTTYVLDKLYDDDGTNKKWIDKLNTVAQWFFISDLTDNEVVEERAYTVDGDLVYSFVPVKNADGKIIGSYNDAWGLPVDMREDDSSTYGSVVCITYDECGRDHIIDFLDGQGLRKYNSNGVDQQRYLYDDKDRVILVTSHNLAGDYAIDNWGNCGNRYEYNDLDNSYSIIIVDNELQPMRMPSTRADGTKTFIRCDIRRDIWGRNIEATMCDADGNADATSSGIHKILYNYDEKGTLQSVSYYNMEGEKIN